jgi:tetratricopeptide (TPR) repeat protein
MTVLAILLAVATAQDLVRQANTAMSARQYQQAAQLYQEALTLRPQSPEAHYDLGGAYYRLGDFSRALESFERAATLRRKGRLAAMARYNAAHCLFQQGLGLVYTDPEGALGVLEQSLASFREASRLDAAIGPDAGHNADVVKKWMELIGRQLAQQRAAGMKGGPPVSGPGPAVNSILGQDKGARSAGGANVRPISAGKDW